VESGERSEEPEGLAEREGGPAPELEPKLARAAEVARRTDTGPRLLGAVKFLRQLLPGDSELGDPLSTGGRDPSNLIARRVSEAAAGRPSVSRELGLGALQVWQALAEAQGRGRGDEELTILFTDLVDFSNWAVEAGDEATLELLRQVGLAVEPPITKRRGEVVKRLGDGLMAVFLDSRDALQAAHEARDNVAALEVAGYRPALRAGLHLGRPRKLGGDYLGVDVNVAARVCEGADGGEVLISEAALARLDRDELRLRKRRRFRAKGAPKDLEVYAAEPR
jgi:adenylate cyclase